MKTFKFRLQTVLEQRQRQEQLARATYAEACHAEKTAQQLLEELVDVRGALIEELSHVQKDGFNPAESRLYYEYLQVVTRSIREQEAYIGHLAQERAQTHATMIHAAQKQQVLASVRDRHAATHQVTEERKEQNAMDELATLRFTHQKRPTG